MINYRPEVELYYKKYKDIETAEELQQAVSNVPKVKGKEAQEMVQKAFDEIIRRYFSE